MSRGIATQQRTQQRENILRNAYLIIFISDTNLRNIARGPVRFYVQKIKLDLHLYTAVQNLMLLPDSIYYNKLYTSMYLNNLGIQTSNVDQSNLVLSVLTDSQTFYFKIVWSLKTYYLWLGTNLSRRGPFTSGDSEFPAVGGGFLRSGGVDVTSFYDQYNQDLWMPRSRHVTYCLGPR